MNNLNAEQHPSGGPDRTGLTDVGLGAETVIIIVNGRPKTVPKHGDLTYDEVVRLAFPSPQTGDGVQYTVQYTRGPGHKPSGTLVEGQSVKVKAGMEFDVTPTNRS